VAELVEQVAEVVEDDVAADVRVKARREDDELRPPSTTRH
jgi:hypothetical protein